MPEKLNPLTNKVEDFELSDLCFSNSHAKVPPDTNIYIINCVNDSTNSIISKISRIEKSKPKAIGIDLIFNVREISTNIERLIDTINQYKQNIILAVKYSKDPAFNQLLQFPFYKKLQAKNDGEGNYNWGYLKDEPQFEAKRYFEPFLAFNDGWIDAFSVKTIRIAYGDTFLDSLKKRKNLLEIINYRNSIEADDKEVPRYTVLDTIPNAPGFFKDKVVLFGKLDNASLLDLHYTPLNKYIVSRSLPDMHGIVYHAQIMSMIIDNDYISEISWAIKIVLVFFVCFIFMFVFNWLLKFHNLYHLFVDTFFVIITVPLSILISRWLLDAHKIKFEPTFYLIPLFFCGLAVHLYKPAGDLYQWGIKAFRNKAGKNSLIDSRK